MKLNILKKITAFSFLAVCSIGILSGVSNAMHTGASEILSSDSSLHHVGTKPIETERLLLRRFKISDAPHVFHNWAKDPENVMHLTWNAHPSVGLTESLITSWVADYSEIANYRWVITLKGTDVPIGGIDVTSIHGKSCEIGFVLSKALWGKGIMPEAAKAVIAYLFTEVGFETVTAYHNIDNLASGRVLEKVGMTKIKILKNGAKKNTGELVDTVVYAISRV